jgi:hypothetical protein
MAKKNKSIRQNIGKYSKRKGSSYERQIAKELRELTGNENITTSRASNKKLDSMKIDIHDEDNILPCYIQTKKTQSTPQIKKINTEVGKIDKPLAIFWNIQEKKDGNINITSAGEYVIISKDFFYKILKQVMKK